ncbi:MAG TPA: LysM peptidoglycan-binding domain-containing protein [Gemmatimonadaceae bacterium]
MPLIPLRSRGFRRAWALAAASTLIPALASAQSLRGSKASIRRMYDQAVEHKLHFYETSTGVRNAVREGDFVRLSGNADYELHQVSFPYVTDETHLFVERLASQYHAVCGEKLVVTSAIRPESRQPANSADLSVHPTGMAVDLRKPTRGKCLKWLRSTLLALEDAAVLEATEEHHPVHFHVAVYPRPYSSYVRGVLASAAADDAAEEAPVRARAAESSAPRATATHASTVRYEVERGDTLWHLARRYGTTVRKIQAANHLSTTRLKPGQEIVIPASGQ